MFIKNEQDFFNYFNYFLYLPVIKLGWFAPSIFLPKSDFFVLSLKKMDFGV